MAKNVLLVSAENNYVPQAIRDILIENGHTATIVLDSSTDFNLSYVQQFDVLFAVRQRNNLSVTRDALESGIPVIAGMAYSNSAASECGMFTQNTERYDGGHNNCYSVNSDGLTPLGEFQPYDSSTYSGFYLQEHIAQSGKVLCTTGRNSTNINVAVFSKGTQNLNGGVFAANCAYIGCSHGSSYSQDGNLLFINVLNYVTDELLALRGVVKLQDGTAVSRRVVAHERESGRIVFDVNSGSGGEFAGFVSRGSYYCIAFDENGGNKNAVIIDKIVV